MVVVAALIATVAAVISIGSTLALRASLVGQIDDRLRAASERALAAPARFDTMRPTPEASTSPSEGGATADASPDPTEPEGSGPDPSAGGDPDAQGTDGTRPDWFTDGDVPPALGLPGQDIGTVNVYERGGTLLSGYLDDSGSSRSLTDQQLDVLTALTPDGEPVTVDLPDLGTYRAVYTTSANGDISITALPLGSVTSTVDRFLGVEIGVALAGLVLAGALATVLVRRELRPLDRVAATATRVAQIPLARGDVEISERVPEPDTHPDTEVGQVGAALNQMLGHVEEALTARHESETQVRRFVADASHELRTPLASIRGYAELVQRHPDGIPDEALHAVGRVESEARRMSTLVEDMLLLARLDAGRDLDLAEVDLGALAVDAVADAHVAGRGHRWRLDLADGDEDDPEPALVIGDEHRLRQVLVNLVTNARVHTPAGTEVVVRVRVEGEQVVLQVRDDGPGIDEPLRSRLFERFTRGDASRNRAAGSTGLGLAIVHAVVTAHEGTIDVDSVPGSTTFTVRLPRAVED